MAEAHRHYWLPSAVKINWQCRQEVAQEGEGWVEWGREGEEQERSWVGGVNRRRNEK